MKVINSSHDVIGGAGQMVEWLLINQNVLQVRLRDLTGIHILLPTASRALFCGHYCLISYQPAERRVGSEHDMTPIKCCLAEFSFQCQCFNFPLMT